MSGFDAWMGRLLGHTRRRRIAALAVMPVVTGAIGFAYAAAAGRVGVIVALAIGGLLLARLLMLWRATPPPRAPWDQPGWTSTHTPTMVVCAVCGFPCLGGFYIEAPHLPGVYVHTMSCGPALPGMRQFAEPTHERGPGGELRPREM